MSYLFGEGSIFKKTYPFGLVEYYQIVSGSIEFLSPINSIYTLKSRYSYFINVCLLKTDYTYTTLEPCMHSSKSHYEYRHYKMIKDETYNIAYDKYIKFEDFLIDDWHEIIHYDDLFDKFKIACYRNKSIFDNNLFLKPTISKKVSYTYYDIIENKNKTINFKI
jgi:hypothetical protein